MNAGLLHTFGPLLNAKEMARIWDISLNGFYKKAQEGTWDDFLVTPAIPPRKYSKAIVERYLNGEDVRRTHQRVFGRRRA